jgi:hypothetical protein
MRGEETREEKERGEWRFDSRWKGESHCVQPCTLGYLHFTTDSNWPTTIIVGPLANLIS